MQSTAPSTNTSVVATLAPGFWSHPITIGLGQAASIFFAALLAYVFGEWSSRRRHQSERREQRERARDAALAQFAMSGIDFLRHRERDMHLIRVFKEALSPNGPDLDDAKTRARETNAGLARAVDNFRLYYGELMLHEDRQDFREYIDSVFNRVLYVGGEDERRTRVNMVPLERELCRLLETRKPIAVADRAPAFAPTAAPAPAESPPAPRAAQSPGEAAGAK